MRFEWLAVSASALVVGATALFFGGAMVPRLAGDGTVLQLALASPESWTITALVLLLAAFGFLVGVPSLEPLLRRGGLGVGLGAMILLAVTAVLLAGFAMQLVMLRGLESQGSVSEVALAAAMRSPLQQTLLMIAFVSFFVGELFLAWALTISRTVPRWVPWMFVGHVVGWALLRLMGASRFDDAPAVLMVVGFVGTAMTVNRPDISRRRPARVRPRRGHPVT